MSATKSKRPIVTAPPKRPEKKYGPFHGGVGLAIWLNQVAGDTGPRFFRSVTIAPRRYRDEKTGRWMDSTSFRATDLPALILALEAAHGYMANTPLPGDALDEDAIDAISNVGEPEIPM
jgi:hypothetical protein